MTASCRACAANGLDVERPPHVPAAHVYTTAAWEAVFDGPPRLSDDVRVGVHPRSREASEDPTILAELGGVRLLWSRHVPVSAVTS